MDMEKIGGRLQPDRKLELPFQDLPLVPVALTLRPRRVVGDRLHLVALAAHGARAAAIAVDDRIDVDIEAKHVPVQERIGLDVAVNTIDVPAMTATAIR